MHSNVSFVDNLQQLDTIISNYHAQSIFILADSNTAIHCFQKINSIKHNKIICLPAGESTKSLDSCEIIWDFLQENGADRNSILINIGGGVITDLGGFAASLYQRGIDFIHIPTSLLAMVDASIGGKTGVDFRNLKNYIGNFTPAKQIIICPLFLNTLPKEEWINGWAEAIKHAFIADPILLLEIKTHLTSDPTTISLALLQNICKIKIDIIAQDPKEKNIRKALNFGHTIGHALESYLLIKNKPVAHGLAVAAGMIMESNISQLKNKTFNKHDEVLNILKYFPRIDINNDDCIHIANLTLKDKKNNNGNINLTTLKAIGEFKINTTVEISLIQLVLENYSNNE